jgi:DtxR family transcriptional regulator, Mn-dependent transcriptional regulator
MSRKRRKKLTHSILHYLMAIHKLREDNKRSRPVDIARHLNVAKSSVTIALKRLKENKLIDEDSNKNLYLNQNGHDYVHNALANRSLLYYFLKNILGVNNQDAKQDACRIEHLLSEDAQKKLFQFLKKLSRCNKEDIKKYDLDVCLCDYKDFSDFKDEQVGDDYYRGRIKK